VLRVRDTGIGMPADLLPAVFDLFTQGERPLDRTEGGLGVGLTIVKQVVTLHGGKVEAHSAGPGQGSEFVVRLPLPANVSTNAAAPTADAAERTPALRILVVDDNQDAADTTAMLLHVLGHEARVAYNGPDALAAASANPPDALLLDIGLPGMDGYEVARRLRADERLQHIPLIAITGYGRDVDYQLSQAAGFDAHLVKPVEARKLEQALAGRADQRREASS
ncbi:MAG: hybrid sensor histidine kinase/response regulator, partial [Pirellulales bacterium]